MLARARPAAHAGSPVVDAYLVEDVDRLAGGTLEVDVYVGGVGPRVAPWRMRRGRVAGGRALARPLLESWCMRTADLFVCGKHMRLRPRRLRAADECPFASAYSSFRRGAKVPTHQGIIW